MNETGGPHHRISVIIPARNEAESLPAMLDELPKDLIHEIIVVDGHSTDGTPSIVNRLGYRVVTQEGMGYGMAVRTGLAHPLGHPCRRGGAGRTVRRWRHNAPWCRGSATRLG